MVYIFYYSGLVSEPFAERRTTSLRRFWANWVTLTKRTFGQWAASCEKLIPFPASTLSLSRARANERIFVVTFVWKRFCARGGRNRPSPLGGGKQSVFFKRERGGRAREKSRSFFLFFEEDFGGKKVRIIIKDLPRLQERVFDRILFFL